MIQIISNHINETNNPLFKFSSLDNPQSLDQYGINIVNLNHDSIWVNKRDNHEEIDKVNDLRNLGIMLQHSQKAINIIVLPQNQKFKYDYRRKNSRETTMKYQKNIYLKNMISSLHNFLSLVFYSNYKLVFENTQTKLDNVSIPSNFYFLDIAEDKTLTKSDGSGKATTIIFSKNTLITTLNLNTIENINLFLNEIGLNTQKEEVPDWIHNITFYDDKEQKDSVQEYLNEIEVLEKKIKLANDQLNENLKYKSILFTNSSEIVEVILEILERIFDYNFDSFVDEKKEDFVMKLNDITFIGEIKGLSSNIRSANVSQLEVHYQGYLDSLAENDEKENTKGLLIINHQRNIDIKDRKPVHETQINLANHYNSLIIETTTLLKIFEEYKDKKLSKTEIQELFVNNSGILKV